MPLSVSVVCEPYPVHHDVLNAACVIKCVVKFICPTPGFSLKFLEKTFFLLSVSLLVK